MEARVNAIEKSLPDIRERLVRVETKLDHTATKTDLADLSIALHKSMNEQTWKFIAAATSMSALFAAIAFGLARLLK